MRATAKQVDHIISLANQVSGGAASYLSQVQDLLPVSKSAVSRGLTSPEASACIAALKDLLAAKEAEAEKAPKRTRAVKVGKVSGPGASIDPADLLSMIGKKVSVTSSKTGNTFIGLAASVAWSHERGTMVLNVNGIETRSCDMAIENIASWKILPR